jgi:hypothetical protein
MRHFKWLMLVAAAAAAGCGEPAAETGPVEVVPVTGQVIYDGKPAAGVRVTLVPMDAPNLPRIPQYANGVTDAEGKFKLTTYAKDDGAPEGGYQVVLDGSKPHDVNNVGDEESEDTDLFKGWYDAMHSNLKVRIAKGKGDLPPFKIAKVTKPAGMSEGIPGRN